MTAASMAPHCAMEDASENVAALWSQFERSADVRQREVLVQRPHHLVPGRVALRQRLDLLMRAGPDDGSAAVRGDIVQEEHGGDSKGQRKRLVSVFFDGMVDVRAGPFPLCLGGEDVEREALFGRVEGGGIAACQLGGGGLSQCGGNCSS